ncbi:unnamed protein product, partial [Scytosiphon promiscuus]
SWVLLYFCAAYNSVTIYLILRQILSAIRQKTWCPVPSWETILTPGSLIQGPLLCSLLRLARWCLAAITARSGEMRVCCHYLRHVTVQLWHEIEPPIVFRIQ